MKILLINWQDPENPHAGGAEVHLREIFGRLRQRGHHVTWLASGWEGSPTRGTVDGMDVVRAGSRYTFGIESIAVIRRLLATGRFDVVVEALNKVPVFSPLWSETPVALVVHHLFGTTAFQQASFPLAAATWLLERPLARVYRKTPVQAISRSTADDLVERGFDPALIDVIHPGVDLEYFNPGAVPERAIAPTFLYLGRLQKYKRITLILEAFSTAVRELPGARLIVAGTGEQEGELRHLATVLGIERSVHFAGFVSEEEKRHLFRSAWANVFVSPKEGWGITNLEAAACGTPTIASDSPGLRESVLDGRTGLLVPHGDQPALVAAFQKLGRDVGLVERLGREAREFATGFSWDFAADATEAHLVGMLGRRGASVKKDSEFRIRASGENQKRRDGR